MPTHPTPDPPTAATTSMYGGCPPAPLGSVTTFVYDPADLPTPDTRDRTTYAIDPLAVPADAGSAVTQWWAVYDAEGQLLESGTGPHPGFGAPDPRDDHAPPDEPYVVE